MESFGQQFSNSSSRNSIFGNFGTNASSNAQTSSALPLLKLSPSENLYRLKGMCCPSTFDFTVFKFRNSHLSRPTTGFEQFGNFDNSHCVSIKMWPFMQHSDQYKQFFSLPVGTSYDVPFSTGSSDSFKWLLRIFPNGIDKSKNSMALYVRLISSPLSDDIKAHIFSDNISSTEISYLPGKEFGFRGWKTKEYATSGMNMFSNSTVPAPFLNFGFKMSLIEASTSSNSLYYPLPSLECVSYLSDVFTKPFDVTLKHKDWTLYAHWQVLVKRSPVIEAMFRNDTAERQSNVVPIQINISESTMISVLKFLYTNRIEDLEGGNWSSLVELSNYYDLKELKNIVSASIIDEVDMNNVVDFLILADKYSFDNLKSFCLQFIKNNKFEIKEAEGFAGLKQQPDLLYEVFLYTM